jgi:hypothetical protein
MTPFRKDFNFAVAFESHTPSKSERESATQLKHAWIECAGDLAKSIAVIQDGAEYAVLGTVAALFGCVDGFAQANSELTGIVKDQTGAVVAGAKIRS